MNIPDVSAILQWALRYCTPAALGALIMWVIGLRKANLEIRRLALENARLIEDKKRSEKVDRLDNLSHKILEIARERREKCNQTSLGVIVKQQELADSLGESLIDVATALTALESKSLANPVHKWLGTWRILG